MIEAGTTGETEANHFTVDWDGPDDPNNPKKSDLATDYDVRLKSPPHSWTFRKKWVVTVLGIRLHFPEPRLICHDCPSYAQHRSGVSHNKPR
jgi:hypothetical protein